MHTLYKPGEHPELDQILKSADSFQQVAAELFDIQGLITIEEATYYFERYTAENEIINSPLYKALKED